MICDCECTRIIKDILCEHISSEHKIMVSYYSFINKPMPRFTYAFECAF